MQHRERRDAITIPIISPTKLYMRAEIVIASKKLDI